MMGERRVQQEALFYEFSLERHVPEKHLLRSIDRFVELDGLRQELAPFYSGMGRPSIGPELLIRMLIVGYCFGIRSERRLCEEVHLNLAYRWFCGLGLDGDVPDHSTFSKNRHGRFRDSDLLRRLFEETVKRCMSEGLVGGDGFAVDASLIRAEANRQRFHGGDEGLPPDLSIPVFDKSERADGTFSRRDFAYDLRRDAYICSGGKRLQRRQRRHDDRPDTIPADGFMRYRASKGDCDSCALKPRCCPNADARKVMRSVHEGARDLARALTEEDEWLASRRERKKIEMLFAHLKRILRLDRLRLRGPNGARDEFHLAATAQNLRKLAMLIPMPTPISAM